MADVEANQLSLWLTTVRQLAPLIRHHADEAERNRRLSQPVVTALAEAGIFRMCTPRALGGFEVHPLTFYRVVEEIARLDGSTGWCVFIAGCNPLMGAYLTDHAAQAVFGRDPHVAVAGVVLPYGKAISQDKRPCGKNCKKGLESVNSRYSILSRPTRTLLSLEKRAYDPY